MNCSTTYQNVPPALSSELIQHIWSKGGYALAEGNSIKLLADERVFYPLDVECRRMITPEVVTEPVSEPVTEPATPVEEVKDASN